jgi:hypothetical protein
MKTLTLQVTEVSFDFDELDSPEDRQEVIDSVVGVLSLLISFTFLTLTDTVCQLRKWHKGGCDSPRLLPYYIC